jgi:DNA polymerase-1
MAVKSYEDFPSERLYSYAGVDALVTYELLRRLMPSIKNQVKYKQFKDGKEESVFAPSILSEARNIKHPAMEFMLDMEINGILYDQVLNRQYDQRMCMQLATLEEEVFTGMGKSINLGSGTELSQMLYGDLGFPVTVFTKKGQPAVSGDAIKALEESTGLTWLKSLRMYTDISSVHSSFIKTYIGDWVKRDGRVHPNYNLHGTSSHRISSDNPNLLNLPKPVHGYNVRECYTVPRGYIFVTADFSSCEVKILAALCQDEKMLEAILGGLDFHSYTASVINGIPYEEFHGAIEDKNHPLHKKYKVLRGNAKAVTFGILYGSSLGGIAAGLGITQKEAENLVALYFGAFPRIKDFVEDCHKMAIANQYIFTRFGQRKMTYGTLPCFRRTAAYNASLRNSQNVMIQSTASTLGLVAFGELNRRNKLIGVNSLATVYDSIETESPLKKVAQAIDNCFVCMDDWPQEQFDWLTFPIGTDVEIGYSWGELTTVRRGVTQGEVENALRELNPNKFEECLLYAA